MPKLPLKRQKGTVFLNIFTCSSQALHKLNFKFWDGERSSVSHNINYRIVLKKLIQLVQSLYLRFLHENLIGYFLRNIVHCPWLSNSKTTEQFSETYTVSGRFVFKVLARNLIGYFLRNIVHCLQVVHLQTSRSQIRSHIGWNDRSHYVMWHLHETFSVC
jgi:hypothetical protein